MSPEQIAIDYNMVTGKNHYTVVLVPIAIDYNIQPYQRKAQGEADYQVKLFSTQAATRFCIARSLSLSNK